MMGRGGRAREGEVPGKGQSRRRRDLCAPYASRPSTAVPSRWPPGAPSSSFGFAPLHLPRGGAMCVVRSKVDTSTSPPPRKPNWPSAAPGVDGDRGELRALTPMVRPLALASTLRTFIPVPPDFRGAMGSAAAQGVAESPGQIPEWTAGAHARQPGVPKFERGGGAARPPAGRLVNAAEEISTSPFPQRWGRLTRAPITTYGLCRSFPHCVIHKWGNDLRHFRLLRGQLVGHTLRSRARSPLPSRSFA
jgi:hypothetical protein